MNIGIVGKIGTGKSTVAQWFADRKNFVRIDMDAVGHQVLVQSSTVRAQLQKKLPEIFSQGSMLSRGKIASIVFQDKAKLEILNSIIHPEMIKSIESTLQRNDARDVVIDGALLYEMGLDRWCDAVLFIESNYERAVKRSNRSSRDFWKIWKSQEFLDARREQAHFVIDNSGDESQLIEKISDIYSRIKTMK